MKTPRDIANEISKNMRNAGREMGMARRAMAEKRKNEFLHTRVSDALKEKIRDRAESLEIPISILIRNILEAYFEHACTASDKTTQLEIKTKPTNISGWQEFLPFKKQLCTSCGRDLKKGEKAYRGIGENGEFLDTHCSICVSEYLS